MGIVPKDIEYLWRGDVLRPKDSKFTATELDKKFDDGNKQFQKINVDMPVPMLKEIDAEADRLGINRQALIKVWLDDKLLSIKTRRA